MIINNRFIGSIIVIILIIITTFSFVISPSTALMSYRHSSEQETNLDQIQSDDQQLRSLIFHEPIYIDGDDDFIAQAFFEGWDLNLTRDGSQNNPFLIEGYLIYGFSSTPAIYINNTNLFFEIRNNDIIGNFSISPLIYLEYVSNIEIKNNLIQESDWGIYARVGSNYRIENNTIQQIALSGNGEAISLQGLSDVTVLNNYIVDSGAALTVESVFKDKFPFALDDMITTNILIENNLINIISGGPTILDGVNIVINNNTIVGGFIQVQRSINVKTLRNNLLDTQGIEYFLTNNSEIIGNNITSSKIPIIDESSSPNLTGIILSGSSQVNVFDNIVENVNRGIYIDNSHHNNFVNNQISNVIGRGIDIIAGDNLNISSNIILKIDGPGIFAEGVFTNSLIEKNTISDAFHGIYLKDSGFAPVVSSINDPNFSNVKNNTIRLNSLNNNEGNGIYIRYAKNNTIESNLISDNMMAGIFLNNTDDMNIVDNDITSNMGYGIYLNFSKNTKILGNNDISANFGNGLYLNYSIETLIMDNSISSQSENGLYLFYSDQTNIENNDISDNEEFGVYMINSSSVDVIENTISNNGLGGIFIDPAEGISIFQNTVSGNGGIGITLQSVSTSIIDSNIISGNLGNGITLISSNSNQIKGNIIENNVGYGLQFINSNSNTVQDNTYSGNVVAIAIDDSSENEISDNVGILNIDAGFFDELFGFEVPLYLIIGAVSIILILLILIAKRSKDDE